LNTNAFAAPLTGLDSYEFSDIYKQMWYNANTVDPTTPTEPEQASAHSYVRNLLRDKLINILVYGVFD
jgi:hypothetical protein